MTIWSCSTSSIKWKTTKVLTGSSSAYLESLSVVLFISLRMCMKDNHSKVEITSLISYRLVVNKCFLWRYCYFPNQPRALSRLEFVAILFKEFPLLGEYKRLWTQLNCLCLFLGNIMHEHMKTAPLKKPHEMLGVSRGIVRNNGLWGFGSIFYSWHNLTTKCVVTFAGISLELKILPFITH